MRIEQIYRLIFTGVVALLLPIGIASANDAVRLEATLKPYIDSGKFMGTVLVTSGDKVLLDKGYGFANREWGIPNAPDTKFRIGSITKQFTATAIFLLQERGKLNISDPVAKYVPDLPDAWKAVTVSELLTHTSGIPNFTDLKEYWARRSSPATPEQLIGMVREMPLDFPPGSKWNYSNTGYDILGMIIEKVSGQSYASFLTDNIFNPLGMKDTGYDNAATILARRASGYVYEKDLKNAEHVDVSMLFAAGGLYSTTHDLHIWERALFSGKLLSPASFEKITARHIATALEGADYGCGLFIQNIGGHTVIGHPGFTDGFNAETLVIPDLQITVVVLSNVSAPEPVMWGTILARAMLNK